MSGSANGETDTGIDRRNVLQAIGAAGAIGLAGCQSGDDGGDGSSENLGERVPELTLEYFSNAPRTPVLEAHTQVLEEDFGALGMNLNPRPVDGPTLIQRWLQDIRTNDITISYSNPTPARLDPDEILVSNHINTAGATGTNSSTDYANCEASDLIVQQRNAPTEEDRQELVTDAFTKLAEDRVVAPTINVIDIGVVRSDVVEPAGVGTLGINLFNPNFYIESEVVDGNQMVADINQAGVSTSVFTRNTGLPELNAWNHLVASPLLSYDEDLELRNVLASSYDVADEARQITVELRDATFHNGDPITAEDVQFTFQYIANNSEAAPQASQPPYSSIDIIDDQTVEFNFEQSYLPQLTKVFPRWGILHKESWVASGAQDDPGGFELDEIIGSGPFQVETFERDSALIVSPHDDHPVHDPGHEIVFQPFQGGAQTKSQAFQNNEVHVITQLSPSVVENIRSNLGDQMTSAELQGWTCFRLEPRYNHGPGMFRPFRDAIGKALNRQKMNAVALNGTGTEQLHPLEFATTHPWFDDDADIPAFTESIQGDTDSARQVLEDAGWGWDDDDRLHYPPDADLSPRWPEESTPSPEDYPCLDEDGSYIPPSER